MPGVQQFEFFMSGHMDILANNPSHDEILQLALLQPNSSEVFIQASARVCGDRKKSWFKWRLVHTYNNVHVHVFIHMYIRTCHVYCSRLCILHMTLAQFSPKMHIYVHTCTFVEMQCTVGNSQKLLWF